MVDPRAEIEWLILRCWVLNVRDMQQMLHALVDDVIFFQVLGGGLDVHPGPSAIV